MTGDKLHFPVINLDTIFIQHGILHDNFLLFNGLNLRRWCGIETCSGSRTGNLRCCGDVLPFCGMIVASMVEYQKKSQRG